MALEVLLDNEATHRVPNQDRLFPQPIDHRRQIVDVIGDRMPVEALATVAARVSAQGERVARKACLGQKGHEGVGPHPAAGKGAMDEKQRRAIRLVRWQAGEKLDAADFFGSCHCNSMVG